MSSRVINVRTQIQKNCELFENDGCLGLKLQEFWKCFDWKKKCQYQKELNDIKTITIVLKIIIGLKIRITNWIGINNQIAQNHFDKILRKENNFSEQRIRSNKPSQVWFRKCKWFDDEPWACIINIIYKRNEPI